MSPIPVSVALAFYNMGGPETASDVPEFLKRLFEDYDLLGIPFGAGFQNFVARRIVAKRAAAVQQKYMEIGGGSPQRRITEALCHKVQTLLARSPANAAVSFDWVTPMFRYTAPRASEILTAAQARGIHEIWLVSQYPHCARATTGTTLRELGQLRGSSFETAAPQPKIKTLESYYDHPEFIALWTARLASAWNALPPGKRFLLISAHNLPVSYIAMGDPYRAQIYRTVREVTRRLRLAEHTDWELSWQSAVGPVKWMAPDTRDVLRTLAAQTPQPAVLAWPVSFVSDHIETLHEIDIEFAEIAHAAGLTHLTRVPNLNDDDDFASFLVNRIAAAANDVQLERGNSALRNLEKTPQGPGCHMQPGGCLCGRYFVSGQQGLSRTLVAPLKEGQKEKA